MFNRKPDEVNVDNRGLDSISSTISRFKSNTKQAVIARTVETLISIRSSSLSSEDLSEIAELYLICQGGKTMRREQGNLISADKIRPTAFAISTRGSRGVITKSRTQLALESQERFNLAEKEKKRVYNEKVVKKNESREASLAGKNRVTDS